jgi:hypothetical protein
VDPAKCEAPAAAVKKKCLNPSYSVNFSRVKIKKGRSDSILSFSMPPDPVIQILLIFRIMTEFCHVNRAQERNSFQTKSTRITGVK